MYYCAKNRNIIVSIWIVKSICLQLKNSWKITKIDTHKVNDSWLDHK